MSFGVFSSIYLLLPRKSEIRLKSENLHRWTLNLLFYPGGVGSSCRSVARNVN